MADHTDPAARLRAVTDQHIADGLAKLCAPPYNLDDVTAALDELEQLRPMVVRHLGELNAAYRERAHLVALLAAQYPSRWGVDPDWTEWRIVYVDLPTGQASWHISPDDVALFPHVTGDGGDREWDGHTTAAKYERIDQLTALLAQAGEPDEEQLGQMAVPRFEIERLAQSERDVDLRAVDALITASAMSDMPAFWTAFDDLRTRYIDRIAALDARKTDGGTTR